MPQFDQEIIVVFFHKCDPKSQYRLNLNFYVFDSKKSHAQEGNTVTRSVFQQNTASEQTVKTPETEPESGSRLTRQNQIKGRTRRHEAWTQTSD